jgi:hypothetical protein
MSCSHEKETSRWVEEENWYTGETEGRWEWSTQSTTVDIDLHRYKCTQCGLVMYYSGRARAYYEEGQKFDWITGLDK